MTDYEKYKGKQFLAKIIQLRKKIKSDIENNWLSEGKIHNKIVYYEKKYGYYEMLHLDPEISPDLIRFKEEILILKDRLKKS